MPKTYCKFLRFLCEKNLPPDGPNFYLQLVFLLRVCVDDSYFYFLFVFYFISDDPYFYLQFQPPEERPPSFFSLDTDGRVVRYTFLILKHRWQGCPVHVSYLKHRWQGCQVQASYLKDIWQDCQVQVSYFETQMAGLSGNGFLY